MDCAALDVRWITAGRGGLGRRLGEVWRIYVFYSGLVLARGCRCAYRVRRCAQGGGGMAVASWQSYSSADARELGRDTSEDPDLRGGSLAG